MRSSRFVSSSVSLLRTHWAGSSRKMSLRSPRTVCGRPSGKQSAMFSTRWSVGARIKDRSEAAAVAVARARGAVDVVEVVADSSSESVS